MAGRGGFLPGWVWLALALGGCAPAPAPVSPASERPPTERPRPDEGEPWEQKLPEAGRAPGPPRAGFALPPGASCAETLAALRLAAPELPRPPPIGLVLSGGAARAAAVEVDLPLPVMDAPDPAGPDCVLLVDAPLHPEGHQERRVERTIVASEYRAGASRQPNPEHRRLRRELAEVERGRGHGGRIAPVGDPMLDLIGAAAGLVLQGVARFEGESRERELEALLEATPATLEEPRWEPYSYELARIRTGRAATFRVALVDRRDGSALEAPSRVDERRTFEVPTGRRTRDRAFEDGVAEAGPSLSEIRQWERTPPRVALSTLIEHLLAAGIPRRGDAAAVLAGWGKSDGSEAGSSAPAHRAEPTSDRPAAAPEADAGDRIGAAASVVEVEGATGRSLGFYIGPETVLTTAGALGRSSLIRVGGRDGPVGFGLVERVDSGRGLALVRVAARGRPLAIHEGPPPDPGAMLASAGTAGPGAPVALGRSIVEPALADGDLRDVRYLELEPGREGAGDRQPAGAPLLLDGRVVGMHLGGDEEEPRVLHYQELRDFLAGGPG